MNHNKKPTKCGQCGSKDIYEEAPPDFPHVLLSPGSNAALEAGCVCPVLDNEHGQGYMGVPGQWVIVEDCPVHTKKLE